MKKILLVGASLNSGNRGVNALTRGTINSLIEQFEDVSVKILSYSVRQKVVNTLTYNDKELNVEEIPVNIKQNIQSLNIFKIIKMHRQIKKFILEADVVLDISEGDSFSDIYGIKRFILHSIIKLYSVKFSEKFFLLPQTIGPFKRAWVKKSAKYLINGSTKTFVRDSISYKVVTEELGVKDSHVEHYPDMAFYMKPNDNVNASVLKDLKKQGKTIIGLNISGLLYNGGYTGKNMFDFKVDYKELIDHIVKYFMEEKDTVVILVPHVIVKEMPVEDDLQTSENIYRNLKQDYSSRVHIVNDNLREDELKKIISFCDFFIGGRMHACIGAISTSVPTIPIAYSRKFAGIWNDFGLGFCVADPRAQDIEEIINIINNNYNNRLKIKEMLLEKNKYVKNNRNNMYKSMGL